MCNRLGQVGSRCEDFPCVPKAGSLEPPAGPSGITWPSAASLPHRQTQRFPEALSHVPTQGCMLNAFKMLGNTTNQQPRQKAKGRQVCFSSKPKSACKTLHFSMWVYSKHLCPITPRSAKEMEGWCHHVAPYTEHTQLRTPGPGGEGAGRCKVSQPSHNRWPCDGGFSWFPQAPTVPLEIRPQSPTDQALSNTEHL